MRMLDLRSLKAGQGGKSCSLLAYGCVENDVFNELGTNTENLSHEQLGQASMALRCFQKTSEYQGFLDRVKKLVTPFAAQKSRRKIVFCCRSAGKKSAMRVRINSLVSEIEQCEKNSTTPSSVAGKVEALKVRNPAKQSAVKSQDARALFRTSMFSVDGAAFLRVSAEALQISTNF